MVVAQEVIYTMKKKKVGNLRSISIKLDRCKAYDRMEWDYLEVAMTYLGFPPCFIFGYELY